MAMEKHEKHLLYNSLSILLKAVERQQTTVDLRNEASIFGTVEEADAYVTHNVYLSLLYARLLLL